MHEPTGSGTDLIAVGADAEVVVGQDVGCGDVAIDVVVRGLFTSICIQLVTVALVFHVSMAPSPGWARSVRGTRRNVTPMGAKIPGTGLVGP